MVTDDDGVEHDFEVSQTFGLGFLGTLGHPVSITCWTAEVGTNSLAKRQAITDCDSASLGDRQLIQYQSGDHLFGMFVPRDGTQHKIGQPGSAYKCFDMKIDSLVASNVPKTWIMCRCDTEDTVLS